MDFGDLKDDKVIQDKLLKLQNSVNQIDNILELALNNDFYEKLSVKDKVDYNLFLGYALNTLYWLYLRTKGLDPSTNEVKNQINRIRQYMKQAKEAHERNTIRPKLNQSVAARFIKHGIQYNEKSPEEPPSKKRKK